VRPRIQWAAAADSAIVISMPTVASRAATRQAFHTGGTRRRRPTANSEISTATSVTTTITGA